jgi:hypothetical protein
VLIVWPAPFACDQTVTIWPSIAQRGKQRKHYLKFACFPSDAIIHPDTMRLLTQMVINLKQNQLFSPWGHGMNRDGLKIKWNIVGFWTGHHQGVNYSKPNQMMAKTDTNYVVDREM